MRNARLRGFRAHATGGQEISNNLAVKYLAQYSASHKKVRCFGRVLIGTVFPLLSEIVA